MLIQQRMSQVIAPIQRVDQRMVMANTILQMSSLELQAKVEQELLENPALELAERTTCTRCRTPLADGVCPQCAESMRLGGRFGLQLSWADIKYGSYLADGSFPDDEAREEDPMTRIQASVSLADHLRGQFRAILPTADVPIGEFLIGNLNDEGYLECDLSEVAARFGTTVGRAEAVLATLQTLDPPGVGARNLQECLLVQIQQLAEEGQDVHLARELVENCWRDLVLHSYERIGRRLKANRDEVRETLEFIRGRLNPYPGRSFSAQWGRRGIESRMVVRPDVLIRRGHGGYELVIVEQDQHLLKISDDYKTMLRDYARPGTPESEEVRSHVAQYLSRAQLLIRSIGQRRRTLLAIASCIVECQRAFLDTGSVDSLQPLTRADVATKVGMHESTVSRATAGKFAQMPAGETIPFDDFFHGSLRIKEKIRHYIVHEDPASPLTDQEIAELLLRDGIQVARRTVLKYREQMRILASSQRRGIRDRAGHASDLFGPT